MVQVAVVQHCASTDVDANLQVLARLTREAHDAGATVVTWAEAFAYLGSHQGKVEILEPLPNGGPILAFCQELAQELGIELLLGGFHEAVPGDKARCFNTSVYLGSNGEIAATYRKIHLFDVHMEDGPQLTESKHTAPGDKAVNVETAFGNLGMTVCYDLRFPALYQTLTERGALALSVPSAFTATTGALHWHPLLRARAIENQSYVIAPAQHGQHSKHRASFGHALIVDPWGKVIAEVPDGDGFAIADIEPEACRDARSQIPSLANQRPFE